MTDKEKIAALRQALGTLLDNVGFDRHACSITDMVGACIPKEVLPLCRKAMEDTK